MEPTDQFSSPSFHAPSNSSLFARFGRLVTTLRLPRSFPGIKKVESLANGMRPGDRLILIIAGFFLTLATTGMLYALARENMTEQPSPGGSLTEGIIGTPRFINPLLASSDADRDLTALVYSGLLRAMPNGTLIPDLAESYSISEDGKEYTFTLRDNVSFHDGTPLTAADVVFTIELAQNPLIKSPKRANWDGVVVETIDERTLRFTLPQSYAPFLENLTLGIIPRHLWGTVTADSFPFNQLNTHPIGTGPYEVRSIKSDSSSTPIEYILNSFSEFALGEAYIRELHIRFYANEDAQIAAHKAGLIEGMAGITASKVGSIDLKHSNVLRTELPRVFAVFLNQNEARIFLSSAVREALNTSLDKSAIIETALRGYGTPLDGPIPPGVMQNGESSAEVVGTSTPSERIEKAQSILTKAGWTINEETGFFQNKDKQELAFSISTADTPELVASANAVADTWKLLGANVSVKIFSASAINLNVIRPRTYDALLFGEIVGRSLDLYAFWHSSQRTDPGLNLALYTNGKADTLLSDARAETDRRTREELYSSFAEEVHEDRPAVFLYAPDLLYITPANLKGITLGALTTPSDRFQNVWQWHIETKRVWDIFSK